MKPLNTLTVGELIMILKSFPDDTEVAISYPSGDYWHTELVMPIKEPGETEIEWSGYHTKWMVPKEPDGDPTSKQILILNADRHI